MPCRSQEKEEDLEGLEVDLCLLGSSLGAGRLVQGAPADGRQDRRGIAVFGRRAGEPSSHCTQPWTLLSRPAALPDLPFCQSRFPALPQLLRSPLWAVVGRGRLVEPCAASSRTGPQLGRALLPGRARCSPCMLHTLRSGVWLRDALASQSLRQPLVQRPGCAPHSTARTCFSSLCGFEQM
jgi:hypothetical protein